MIAGSSPVFVVGRIRANMHLYDMKTGEVAVHLPAWDLITVATSEELADQVCTEASDFYFPVVLDKADSRKVEAPLGAKWPRKKSKVD